MLYIAKPPNFQYTSLVVNMWKMNQFHTHSQKKQNPAKKFIKSGQIERRRKRERRLGSIGGGEGEIVRRRRDWVALESDWCDRRSGAIVGLVRSSLFFLSLSLSCDRRTGATSAIFSLSLSLSLSLLFSKVGSHLKWKWKRKSFSIVLAIFFGQLEMLFRLTKFEVTTKHLLFRKIISRISLKSKQTEPK